MMGAVVVTTQAELDAALTARAAVIEVRSDPGVWLTVTGGGSSRVVARGSSSVEAWGSSHVEAWGSSRVVARGSSHVVARGSSRVEASKYVAVHLHSTNATVAGGVVIDVTDAEATPESWCHYHGVKVSKAGIATLYKAVDDEWTTPRGTSYKPGSKPCAPDWVDNNSCGGGLHFSPSPSQARDYHEAATRFVAVGVRVSELRPITDGGAAKCKAPRVVRACVEVDVDGEVVK